MPRRNPYLVLGFLAVLVGVVLLFVPPIPPAGPGEPDFAAYWWIAGPSIVIGVVLMAIGRRRYLASRRPSEE